MNTRTIGLLCVAIIAALLVIGVASHEVIRHAIQSLPAFVTAIFAFAGFRGSKWMAAPVFIVWLALPILIWLFLAGLSTIANGTYSPVEIAMTVVLALASFTGIFLIAHNPRGASVLASLALFALFMAGEVGAMSLSFQPAYAHDPEGFLGAPKPPSNQQ